MTVDHAHGETPLDRLVTLVAHDFSLQRVLGAVDDADRFITLATELAQARGFELPRNELGSALLGDPLGLERGKRARLVAELPPSGWLPSSVSLHNGIPTVDWAYFGSELLGEPFFEESKRRVLCKPLNQLLRYSTPLAELAQVQPDLEPNGFIFHMSHCGSTLVSQMLATSARNIVVSEALPIDLVLQIARMERRFSHEDRVTWLRNIITVFGQKRSGKEKGYFVKFNSWHTMMLPLLRRSFPSVPWIFLYRDPVEVLVSQMRKLEMVPEALFPELYGLEPAAKLATPEIYTARLLGKICEAALANCSDSGGLLVDYAQLPEAVWTHLLPHFGAEDREIDRAMMSKAAQLDAKTRNGVFTTDADRKQQQATSAIRAAAGEYLEGIYALLEARRLSEAVLSR